MTFTIQGELPSLNEIIDACKRRRGKWNAYSTMKEKETKRILQEFMVQGVRPPSIYRPVRINFRWISGSLKKDLDNIAAGKKFILDAMVKGGILKNDTQEQVKGFSDSFELDRTNPRIEVEVMNA